jgi:transcriptional regulator with XRE-family HTH domain
MSTFSDNLRYLRISDKKSQQDIAAALDISRDRYSKYEGKTDPPLDVLRKISAYHRLSIDILLSVDLRKISIDNLLKLDNNRILLPITVDKEGNDFVEVVTQKAKAGYLTGYSDTEYIQGLPQMHIPFLGAGKHRLFPIEGDSMPPHNNTAYIVGKYVENLGEIKKDKTYILITKSEGMTYKRLDGIHEDSLTVKSDNIIYASYKIKLSDILEIWEFAGSYNTKEAEPDDLSNVNIKDVLMELRKDISRMKKS